MSQRGRRKERDFSLRDVKNLSKEIKERRKRAVLMSFHWWLVLYPISSFMCYIRKHLEVFIVVLYPVIVKSQQVAGSRATVASKVVDQVAPATRLPSR
jgi:hypothetical protein